jgi:hypothetical protein
LVGFTPFDPELAKLVAALPFASSLDLYRIEYAAQRLRSEPHRVLAIRRQLQIGMTVQFLSAHNGVMHSGQISAMSERDVTIDDSVLKTRWREVPYAALDLAAGAGSDDVVDADVDRVDKVNKVGGVTGALVAEPSATRASCASPPHAPRRRARADFKVGDPVSFLDRDRQPRFGKITGLDTSTATIICTNGEWRVSIGWLRHVRDV